MSRLTWIRVIDLAALVLHRGFFAQLLRGRTGSATTLRMALGVIGVLALIALGVAPWLGR